MDIEELLEPSLLGFYTHFEVTEIFALRKGKKTPINIFSLFVAEDREGQQLPELTYLTDKLLALKFLKD